jgi:adenine-specific DNA methylase
LKKELAKKKVKIGKDPIPVNWDRQHEDLLLQKGIETFQDFFTERNLLLNTLVLHYINNMKDDRKIYEALRLIFSSSLRDTNIMAFTNEDWQSGKPTTWAKHAYWVPSQFCEVNVLSSMDKAFNRVRSAISFNQQEAYDVKYAASFNALTEKKGNLVLKNLSIEDYSIPENSVDAIITDPPYGSNVQYLELSHFWYVWNKDLYGKAPPNFLREAVCNRKKNFDGAKNMKDYEDNLYRVFSKAYLALKPNRHMVLTFNNKDMGAWLALLFSIFRSGFVLEEDGLYFQDGVDNYKQTAHTKYEGAPYGDFIYAFKKEEMPRRFIEKKTEEDFINDIDQAFKSFFVKFSNSDDDRNEVINEMFLTVIPKIEAFVKSGGFAGDRKRIYSHFNKNYLKGIYA